MTDQANPIAALNDRFRLYGPALDLPGRIVMTDGIAALPLFVRTAVNLKVQVFNAFSDENDPHGEHDFGSFDSEGAGKVFWKIDYFSDGDMDEGSVAPEDPDRCYRLLTILLAEEY